MNGRPLARPAGVRNVVKDMPPPSPNRRIAIAGATGLVGRPLFFQLQRRGFRLSILSRDPAAARLLLPGAAEYLSFRPAAREGRWAAAVDGAEAVLMLAGASSFARRSGPDGRREIRESRLVANRGLVTAMADARVPPRLFVTASSVGYYGFLDGLRPSGAPPPVADERTLGGNDEISRDYRQLEGAARAAERYGVRTVVVRTGLVLATEGALPEIAARVRRFLGGIVPPGDQPLPWIHLEDEIGLWLLALDDPRVRGPLNATAPEPRTNREFMQAIARRLRRPLWLPMDGWIVRRWTGEGALLFSHGRSVAPRKALALCYRFRYPTLDGALRALLRRTELSALAPRPAGA